MSELNIPDLKAAALAATPGPWNIVERPAYNETCITHPDTTPGAASLNIAKVTVRQCWKEQQDAAKDAELLDFVLEKDAFLSRVMADSGSMTYQLMTQDADENYVVLSGEDQFYPSPRAAIAAARRLTP